MEETLASSPDPLPIAIENSALDNDHSTLPSLPPMTGIEDYAYKCFPCGMSTPSKESLTSHLVGKKHLHKISAAGGADCFASPVDLGELPKREQSLRDALFPITPQARKRKNDTAKGQYNCDVCDIQFNSKIPFDAHVAGKKHVNKVKRGNEKCPDAAENVAAGVDDAVVSVPALFSCKICIVTCNSQEILNTHLVGKKHLSKVNKANEKCPEAAGNVAATDDSTAASVLEPKSSSFACEICNITCPSQENLSMHLDGKKHLSKVNKPETTEASLENSMKCELCDVVVVGEIPFTAHVRGKKHMSKVKSGGESLTHVLCEACDVVLPTQELMDQHLNHNSHKKKLDAKKVDTVSPEADVELKQEGKIQDQADEVKAQSTGMEP